MFTRNTKTGQDAVVPSFEPSTETVEVSDMVSGEGERNADG